MARLYMLKSVTDTLHTSFIAERGNVLIGVHAIGWEEM